MSSVMGEKIWTLFYKIKYDHHSRLRECIWETPGIPTLNALPIDHSLVTLRSLSKDSSLPRTDRIKCAPVHQIHLWVSTHPLSARWGLPVVWVSGPWGRISIPQGLMHLVFFFPLYKQEHPGIDRLWSQMDLTGSWLFVSHPWMSRNIKSLWVSVLHCKKGNDLEFFRSCHEDKIRSCLQKA